LQGAAFGLSSHLVTSMSNLLSRRQVISAAAALPLNVASRAGGAQTRGTDQSTLARLRAAKKATVGFANYPPFSGIEPDGTIIGIAPTVTKLIMARLGVPEIAGIVATYGELIPGMQADRWDFIAASLEITRARCGQVLFCDPLTFDGGSLVSLKGELATPPKLVTDLVAQKLIVGASAGGVIARVALDAGLNPANLLQFNSDVAMIDALVAKRIQVAFGNNASLSRAYKQRSLPVDVTFPVADDPMHGSACAFRLADTDLCNAFQQELRTMKASGEYLPIARQYGFDIPAELMSVTADILCKSNT
jgi:polar amino acid transport system substrate-binding protein